MLMTVPGFLQFKGLRLKGIRLRVDKGLEMVWCAGWLGLTLDFLRARIRAGFRAGYKV